MLRSDLAIESGAYKFRPDLQFLGEGDARNNLLNEDSGIPLLSSHRRSIQDRQQCSAEEKTGETASGTSNLSTPTITKNFHQTDGWLSQECSAV